MHEEFIFTPKAAILHQEAKTAKTMLLILGVQMISLIPYLVVVTLRYFEADEASETMSDVKKVSHYSLMNQYSGVYFSFSYDAPLADRGALLRQERSESHHLRLEEQGLAMGLPADIRAPAKPIARSSPRQQGIRADVPDGDGRRDHQTQVCVLLSFNVTPIALLSR